ncbi:hypothetical protein GY45DRAFT_1256343 [Cubamyces sp. BRFM 1775]|nr:hypothetical protein GY45DRAFT_1256343 [Cubamyces sp. BRFM 1775]
MRFLRSSLTAIAICLVTTAHALENDATSSPCFGECSWSLNSLTASGTVFISGGDSAVSDITPDAGWLIIDCDPEATDQDISLYCYQRDLGCDHVYDNGVVGTVVRLPENCGPMPFAIITAEWEHQQRSIPLNMEYPVAPQIPDVRGMSLSTDFASIDYTSGHGSVMLVMVGMSTPDVANDFELDSESLACIHQEQGLRGLVDNSLHSLIEANADLDNHFNKSVTGASPLKLDKTVPLFSKNISCPQQGRRPAFLGTIDATIQGTVDGNVTYGVSAGGTLIPPAIEEFAFFIDLNATFVGALEIDASLTGSISSGLIPLGTIDIPELNIPEILSIGPTLSVSTELTASIDTFLELDVDMAYKIEGMQLVLTSGSHSQSGTFTPEQASAPNISVSPGAGSNAQLAAHLIPKLAFGISTFGSKAQAMLNLDLDANATLDLSLIQPAQSSALKRGCSLGKSALNGCVDVSSGFSVNAGVDADFFKILKEGTSITLFERDFNLVEKCFGLSAVSSAAASASRSSISTSPCPAVLVVQTNSVSCPAPSLLPANKII